MSKASTLLVNICMIILVIGIYLFFAGIIWAQHYKKYILANWGEFRCNPIIMPFAGQINPDVNTAKNFQSCMHHLEQVFFNILTAPFMAILNTLKNILESIVKAFNSLRNLGSIIRKRIEDVVNNLMSRFQNMEEQLRLFIIKLKDMLGKIEGISTVTEYIFIVIALSLQWIFDIPGMIAMVVIIVLVALLGLLAFFMPFLVAIVVALSAMIGVAACFDRNTEIIMKDGQICKISKLKIGDKVSGGGRVLSIMKFKHNNNLYNYKDVIVSGDHLVYDSSIWKRVSECKESKKIIFRKKYVYCVNTEHNLLVTENNITFSDYGETNDKNLNGILNNIIIDNLNNPLDNLTTLLKKINPLFNLDQESQFTGFSKKIVIQTVNGPRCISNISIGTQLRDGTYVTGKIKTCSDKLIVYNYNGIIVSGSNSVIENNKWIRVYQSKQAKKVFFKEKYVYHISTNNNQILVDNIIFGDFQENSNLKLNTFVDKLSCTSKNELYKTEE